MSRFYVTTPIYYVNDLPHIGHTYTTVVADVIARYRRLCGDEVRFLTGTDEHGQKIERAAEERGIEPLALADRVVSRYQELWRTLEISLDDFVRTTEPRHRDGVEEMIRRIDAAGDLYVDGHEGWYCVGCETFYTEKELGDGRTCPIHETAAEWREEENVFFRLSKYEKKLLDWYDSDPAPVRPESRANEVRSFVESGLRDLSVSRAALEWGIPFPGHPDQTVYVWLDALTNYVSALGFGRPDEALFERFWLEGDTRLNLVGKDILRHHAVFWPAFLMSAGLPLPSAVWAHGFWLKDDRKVSKSVGNVPRLDALVEDLGADPVRYYLLRDMVFGQDAQYSDEAVVDRYNSDLANGLGNTLARVTKLSASTFDGRTPPVPCDDNPLRLEAAEAVTEYRGAMEAFAFERALRALWGLLGEVNQYLVEREPWKLVKSEGASDRVSRILWNGLEATRIVATALLPVMPGIAGRVLTGLGIEAPLDTMDLDWGGTPNGAELPRLEPLFPRIDKDDYLAAAEGEPEAADEEGEDALITIDQFFETELKIGLVQAAEPIPKADKLLRLTVDVGEEEPRTLVAGIAKVYEPEALVGRQVIVVANLEPAKLMGVESQGMVLAASVDGRPVLLHPDGDVAPGTPVR